MTALEAIPKISELLVLLVKRVKDRETGALVQQIQQYQLVLHQELIQIQARCAELESENRKLKAQIDEESGPPNPGRSGRGF